MVQAATTHLIAGVPVPDPDAAPDWCTRTSGGTLDS